ncbi:NAD(P)H:quinone oxidoreductase [Phytoactinopolyspora endophytica]|uniref:NAD(P)H:quinone oxidoreductase n=1 Tax=Phytoactinopolyspora endophytica TaxID=1642495 RepID=UPI00101C8327|nr:NAD(P)H:quinone oxidoreductase [Phytoactinopolyspora endophytica]
MGQNVKVAVIYYSSTGNVHALANGAVEGAEKEGAEVRLRRVAELAPAETVALKPEWAGHADATRHIQEAGVNDLIWADAVLFGTPTRYGVMASQLKQFIDTTGPIWEKGLLSDKVYSAFTSTFTNHGGQESTLLSLYNVVYHWGGVIVPPGYTDPVQFELGNPYGTAHISGDGSPADVHLRTVRYQAARATVIARALKQGRN